MNCSSKKDSTVSKYSNFVHGRMLRLLRDIMRYLALISFLVLLCLIVAINIAGRIGPTLYLMMVYSCSIIIYQLFKLKNSLHYYCMLPVRSVYY